MPPGIPHGKAQGNSIGWPWWNPNELAFEQIHRMPNDECQCNPMECPSWNPNELALEEFYWLSNDEYQCKAMACPHWIPNELAVEEASGSVNRTKDFFNLHKTVLNYLTDETRSKIFKAENLPDEERGATNFENPKKTVKHSGNFIYSDSIKKSKILN